MDDRSLETQRKEEDLNRAIYKWRLALNFKHLPLLGVAPVALLAFATPVSAQTSYGPIVGTVKGCKPGYNPGGGRLVDEHRDLRTSVSLCGPHFCVSARTLSRVKCVGAWFAIA
jgi:hypothetical protein